MKKKILCGVVAIGMILCLTGCKSSDYQAAQKLYANREYDEAIAAFEELGDYKDSADMINVCNYEKALDLYDEEEYEEAAQIFEVLGDYEDSEERIVTCAEEAAAAEKYDEAVAIYDELRQNADDADQSREYAYLQLVNYVKENGEYYSLSESALEDTAEYEYAIVSDLTDYGEEKAILALDEDDEIVFVRVYEDGNAETDGFYFLFLYTQTLKPDSVDSDYIVDSVIYISGAYILEVAQGVLDITEYSEDYVFIPDNIEYACRDLYGEETEDDDYPLEGSTTENILNGVTERTMPAISDILAECGLTLNDLGYNY